MKVAIIGGGAAGFFAAISCSQHVPASKIVLIEKSNKLLSKVKISGGGRCNLTNATFNNVELSKKYPRGERFLKKCFAQFSTNNTIAWFESRGVKLKTEADNRMFPETNSSQTIIDCLQHEVRNQGVSIIKGMTIESIQVESKSIILHEASRKHMFDKVIIATGGSPKLTGLNWLSNLGHTIVPPVPSLFTFNMPNEPVKKLMGVAVEKVLVKVQGTKLQSEGTILITHWGMSGPAILKLSAWGARILSEKNYSFTISINWSLMPNEEELRRYVDNYKKEKKKIINTKLFDLPARLWEFLLKKIEIDPDKRWIDLNKKDFNKLINTLFNDNYHIQGKTTFKEEFVTCGGVSLSDIDSKTMESKICPGLYFCGEVMDIDGITGGFNFQAAWTTGYIAGKLR